MPAGRPTKYKPEMCKTVIDLGKQGKSKTQIAATLGISKETLYDWDKNNEEFSDAIKTAMSFSQAWFEDYGQNGMIGEVDGWNPTTWIFTMKNRFRDDYSDTIKQETKVEMEVTSPKEALTEFLKAKSGNAS